MALPDEVTEATVESRISPVLDKLHCADRTQAALLAYHAGLAPESPAEARK